MWNCFGATQSWQGYIRRSRIVEIHRKRTAEIYRVHATVDCKLRFDIVVLLLLVSEEIGIEMKAFGNISDGRPRRGINNNRPGVRLLYLPAVQQCTYYSHEQGLLDGILVGDDDCVCFILCEYML